MTDNELLQQIADEASVIRHFLHTLLQGFAMFFGAYLWKLVLYIKNHREWWALALALGMCGPASGQYVLDGSYVAINGGAEIAATVEVFDGITPVGVHSGGGVHFCDYETCWVMVTLEEEIIADEIVSVRLYYGEELAGSIDHLMTEADADAGVFFFALNEMGTFAGYAVEDTVHSCAEMVMGGTSGADSFCMPDDACCTVDLNKVEFDFGDGVWHDETLNLSAVLVPGAGSWKSLTNVCGEFGVRLQTLAGFGNFTPGPSTHVRFTGTNCGNEFVVTYFRPAGEPTLIIPLGRCRCGGATGGGDADGDNYANRCDCDDDGDGTPDKDEDDDEDGLPNDEDDDDDNDGCKDNEDCEDDDEDGQPNCCDGDDDNDEAPDFADCDWHGVTGGCCEEDEADDDDDGVPNGQDYDQDGDGIPNWMELAAGACSDTGMLAWECDDDDGDGTPDDEEMSGGPFDFPDGDGDGTPDDVDDDDDNDGIPDAEDDDDDDDGTPDDEECYQPDEACNACDGEGSRPGLPDCDGGGGGPDADGDGIPDSEDDDDDNDGIPDDEDDDDDGDGTPDDEEDGGGDGDGGVCECCEELLAAVNGLTGGDVTASFPTQEDFPFDVDVDPNDYGIAFWQERKTDLEDVTKEHETSSDHQSKQVLPETGSIPWVIPEVDDEPGDYVFCIPFPIIGSGDGSIAGLSMTVTCIHTLPLENVAVGGNETVWETVDLVRTVGRWTLLAFVVLRYWGRFAKLLEGVI